MASRGRAGAEPPRRVWGEGREGGEWLRGPELCDARRARAHPYGRGWGRGGDYKTRGGGRAAAEGAKLWPGAQWSYYGDAGPGTGLCGEVSALA